MEPIWLGSIWIIHVGSTHYIVRITRLHRFSHATLKNREEPGYKATKSLCHWFKQQCSIDNILVQPSTLHISYTAGIYSAIPRAPHRSPCHYSSRLCRSQWRQLFGNSCPTDRLVVRDTSPNGRGDSFVILRLLFPHGPRPDGHIHQSDSQVVAHLQQVAEGRRVAAKVSHHPASSTSPSTSRRPARDVLLYYDRLV